MGPTLPPNVGSFTGGFGNSVASPPSGGFGNNVPEPAPQELLSPLVPIQKPLDQERILPGQDIVNSPFAGLISSGLGGMPKQTVDPYQGSYNISTIPYQGGALEQARGTVDRDWETMS